MTDTVVKLLAEKGFLVQDTRDLGRTLADAPPAVTFLMLTYLQMLEDDRVVKLLHAYLPLAPVKSWPTDIPPPVLLALLFDDIAEVRSWAQKQCTLCEVAPTPMENFLPAHTTILKAVATSISSSRPLRDCLTGEYQLSLLQDQPSIWTSWTTLLRFVPIELFRSSRSFELDLRHIVIGHLHDTGNRQPFRYLQCVNELTHCSRVYSHTYYIYRNRFHRRPEELYYRSATNGSGYLAGRGPGVRTCRLQLNQRQHTLCGHPLQPNCPRPKGRLATQMVGGLR